MPSKKCPICSKPSHNRFAPFCCGRCADLDLGKWLKGSYAIPGPPEEADSDASPALQPPGQAPEEE